MERVRVDVSKVKKTRGHALPGKGHKKMGGRQKGTPNKVNALWKDDLIKAAETLGRLEYQLVKVPGTKKKRLQIVGTGEGGQLGFIMSIVCMDPVSVFNGPYAKLLPLQLTGKDGGAIKVEHEVFHQLKDRDLSKISVLELTAMYREASSTRERPPLKLVSGKTIDHEAA